MINVGSLKTIDQIRGKIAEVLTKDDVLELTKSGQIPHYVFTNPRTNESMYFYMMKEVNEWFTRCFSSIPAHNEKITFITFDSEKLLAKCAVPEALSKVKRLYKLPSEQMYSPSGIYFLCEGDEVVYIGKAVNIANRIESHRSEGKKKFDAAYFVVVPLDILDVTEMALIKRLRPKYNISGRGDNATERHKEIAREILCMQ